MIRQTPTGIEIDIRVVPRAGRSGVDGVRGGRLLVRLSAPPVDGAANEALIELVATLLDCPKRAVRLVSGERSRSKRIAVNGVSREAAEERLLRQGSGG